MMKETKLNIVRQGPTPGNKVPLLTLVGNWNNGRVESGQGTKTIGYGDGQDGTSALKSESETDMAPEQANHYR